MRGRWDIWCLRCRGKGFLGPVEAAKVSSGEKGCDMREGEAEDKVWMEESWMTPGADA